MGKSSELNKPCAVRFIAMDTVVTHRSLTVVKAYPDKALVSHC